MSLQLADRSVKYPRGIIEDVLVKVDQFILPADFIVLDMEEAEIPGNELPLILGRPFMATAGTKIDVKAGLLTMTVQDVTVKFQIFEALKSPLDPHDCFQIDVVDRMKEKFEVAPDKALPRKYFEPNQKVLWKKSRFKLFPTRLRSRWTGPYLVVQAYPHSVVEIQDMKSGLIFKVNGHRLKQYLDPIPQMNEEVLYLNDSPFI
ncbi:hypothetical protein ACFX2J_040487 [Malus domestica]